MTLVISGRLLIPVIDQYPLSLSSSVGLILTVAGFIALSGGFVEVIYYDRKRSYDIGQIEKSNQLKNRKIDINVVKDTVKRYNNAKQPAHVSRRHNKRTRAKVFGKKHEDAF